jgi:hypothetical protein
VTPKNGNFFKTPTKIEEIQTCKTFLRRQHAVDHSTYPWLLNGEVVCSSRSLFRSAANCTWLPLRISKFTVFLFHVVLGCLSSICHLVLVSAYLCWRTFCVSAPNTRGSAYRRHAVLRVFSIGEVRRRIYLYYGLVTRKATFEYIKTLKWWQEDSKAHKAMWDRLILHSFYHISFHAVFAFEVSRVVNCLWVLK